MNNTNKNENASVYDLLTKLCETQAQNCSHQSRTSVKQLASKMRSKAYEIVLKKSSIDIPISESDPIVDLLSCHFILQQNVKNVIEYKRSLDLKKAINKLRNSDLGLDKDHVYKILRLLVKLHNTVADDALLEAYKRPFSFGLLEEMLPKPKREVFGSPQPYPVYPPHIFELPFKLNRGNDLNGSNMSYVNYTVDSLDSKSFVTDYNSRKSEIRTFLSPMAFPSLSSTQVSPYSECNVYNFPRLMTPRDLVIPKSLPLQPKISFVTTEDKMDLKNLDNSEADNMNIWELASQVDKDISVDIWEYVSKLPPINERQLIATSSREIRLWRQTYTGSFPDLSITSERQFIRHITYLLIGVETRSFPFIKSTNSFRMKENLILECISREHLQGYIAPLLMTGTYYRRLYDFAFNHTVDDHFHKKGLVFEAAREVVRQYLLKFRLEATEIFEEFSSRTSEDINCMPTLLQILYHMEPLKYEIQTLATIYKLESTDSITSIPHGAELMSYLFNRISLVTHKRTAETLFNSLFIVCRVYFKFIEKFIFEGELDDYFNEFFIRKDNQYVNSRSKRYWDKGFHITMSVAVPDFLRPLATFILLCGKSLRLLKQCNPTDPLVMLISSDHPSMRCCATFEELEREQQVLDVYRTRCLFVSGEPVTFDQILLKREAERKAFTEMASLKQAETMEKIVAERKRLAQLIIAEKQHSLRVLEAAMAEAKASKNKVKQREKQRSQLEEAAEKATEEVDSKLKDDEKNKMLEYYSKLNMEVEKSKIHTEWKIKRLQLDQSRMQLLSSEERNLKREKLELEHQKNEEIMAMSIQSDFKSEDGLDGDKEEENLIMIESTSSLGNENNNATSSDHCTNKTKSQASNDVFSAICNVAKSIFGTGKRKCDNEQELDAQGNVINDFQNNKMEATSSNVIGSNLNQAFDNLLFLEAREAAVKNKLKVMAHEFSTDNENNLKAPIITLTSADEDNNIEGPISEARRNKLKVLGTEFNVIQEKDTNVDEPITEAHREALINKHKVLGAEFDRIETEMEYFYEPRTEAQREAVINKRKVLGVEFDKVDIGRTDETINKDVGFKYNEKEVAPNWRSDAQKEAIINKQRVLGVEYNLPLNRLPEREPANVAQREAIRNRNNVMGSEHYGSSQMSVKKSGLKLNLKPFGDTTSTKGCNSGVVTPGELFSRLDLETPTTAEVPTDGPMTSDIFTPRSEGQDIENLQPQNYLRSDGFNFSMIIDDETAVSEVISDQSIDSSPKRLKKKHKHSVFNIIDGSYNLDDFDPFGVKNWEKYSKNYIDSQMSIDSTFYTHPATIMEEVTKAPYKNIYRSRIGDEDDDECITCNNIATLTACLQRSVMLPLTYQLEVVNNSILTYFLVNLDMYEHLRSLKDYFFLMDGEFSRSICHNLFAKLTKTLNPQELLNFSTLHNILDKALGSSISHVHKFSENLSFTIPEAPLSFQHSSPDVLQCLSLTYTVSWPLNIILSQEALLRYAKVFQFLIKMRRIFWVLSEDFESLKLSVKLARENSRKLLRSPQYISVQLYRHIMASLIRALDNYIVTTCILTSWTEFEKELRKARTLDDLYDCHVMYIKNVLFRCLLNNRSTPVMKLLNDIFTVILKFSRVLKAGEWQQKEANGYFIHTNYAQLNELYHLYEKLTKYLHKVITKLMECGYQRHLVELLTMVNLNGYYDPEKVDTNTSVG
ncbi:unnamed protein product [Leptosia nina]|uniref:Gamma-tubulin complex component 6 n=1 Tax=Leptosia nina TaxID=320188 RepID=A0AAV1J0P1_9NEOP